MKKLVIISFTLISICIALIAYCLYIDIKRINELKIIPDKVYIDNLLLNRLPSNCYTFSNPTRTQDCKPYFIGEENE